MEATGVMGICICRMTLLPPAPCCTHRAKGPGLTGGFSGGIVRNRGQQLWDLDGNSSTAAVAYAVPVLLMLTPFPLLLLLLQV